MVTQDGSAVPDAQLCVTTGEFILTADGRRWHQSLVLQCVSPVAVREELTAAGPVLTTAAPNSTRWLLAKRR
ncbi:hypothetical protein A4G28_16300 [Mycobacterium ostraviense]|uniref:Uncharacterized protein n=1 Tax=Mycobacterium ostraviense TaxID=2738409 RepID=A0A162D314_9MYCO|nr:hypothetical protein A4G28_16300 [Mycobacterium ostraviense]